MTNEQRIARQHQLDALISGARAQLPNWYQRSCPPHTCPALDVEAWLRRKIDEWEEELERLQSEFDHGWECPCASCYFARLELEFSYGGGGGATTA